MIIATPPAIRENIKYAVLGSDFPLIIHPYRMYQANFGNSMANTPGMINNIEINNRISVTLKIYIRHHIISISSNDIRFHISPHKICFTTDFILT